MPVRNVHIIPRIIACIEVPTAVILTHTELIKIQIKIKFTSMSLLVMTFAAIDHCYSYATETQAPFPIGHAYAATCLVIGLVNKWPQQRVLSLVGK